MNVVYKHGVGKHFEITTYPDGQQNVQLDLSYFNNPKEPITIQCSIRDFKELEVLCCLVAAFRKNDFHIQKIDFKYLFGMRSDRAFLPGQPNYFRDVLAPIINQLGVPRLSLLYPHSQVSLSSLNNEQWEMKHCDYEHKCFCIGADKSARINVWFDWNEVTPTVFHKMRLTDGIIHVELADKIYNELKKTDEFTPILIYDDLCDGGATFIAIADYLKENFPERKRFLFITHGLFTKGVSHVSAHYDKVITTNSYQEFADHDKLEVIDVWN